MASITPSTPEARAAVRRVKTIFMVIVAVNLVVIAVVLGPRLFEPKTSPAPAPEKGAQSSPER